MATWIDRGMCVAHTEAWIFALLLLGLLVLSGAIGTAAGATIHVDAAEGSDETGDGSEGSPYATIAAGVGNATDGDTVVVAPGTYVESMIEISRPMTVVSESGDPADTIVGEAGAYSQFLVHADGVTLSGFTVRYGTYTVFLNKADGCTISDNVITQGYVGLLFDGTYEDAALNNTVSRNEVVGNTNIGIQMQSDVAYTRIEDNNVSGNSADGIQLYYSPYDTVRGNTVSGNGVGISVLRASWSVIEDNDITENEVQGVHIAYSTNVTMTGNSLSGNLYNIEISSGLPAEYVHTIDATNTVDGAPVCYWVDVDGATPPADAGFVGLVYCSNLTVSGLSVSHSGAGVLMVETRDSTVEGVTATYCRFGIRLFHSHNVTVSGCHLTRNGDSALAGGIDVEGSSFIRIVENNCTDQIYGWSTGIHVQRCHNVTIEGNVANDNGGHGIATLEMTYSRITGNTANDNLWGSGLTLNSGSDNCVVEGNNASRNGNHGYWVYGSYWNVLEDNVAYRNDNGGGAGFYLGYCGHNTLVENEAMHNGRGVELYNAGYNTISLNVLDRNAAWGIALTASAGNVIMDNSIVRCSRGIELISASDQNVIDGNDCSRSEYAGIRMDYDNEENVITNNTVHLNGGDGFLLNDGNVLNIIAHNTVCNNTGAGIRIESDSYSTPVPSAGNTIYDNILDNAENAYDEFSNVWNATRAAGENIIGGTFVGGNLWSDYEGFDTDGDGIGEEPYAVPGGNSIDALPLMYARPLEADFTWTPEDAVEGDDITFHDRSSAGNASIVNWTWDIPLAGYPITPAMVYTANPVWRFEAGTYEITLTVTDALDQSDSATKELVVGAPVGPTADFTWTPAVPGYGEDVSFLDASMAGSTGIVNWTWDLPDAGYPITPAMVFTPDPVWRFEAGTYEITLTVTDALGLNDSVTKNVAIGQSIEVLPFEWFDSPADGSVGVSAAVSGAIDISCEFMASNPHPDVRLLGPFFEVTSWGDGGFWWINLTYRYPANATERFNASGIVMYWWDDAEGEWTEVEDSGHDPSEGYVWANLTHHTLFSPGTSAPPAGREGGGEGGFGMIAGVVAAAVLLIVLVAAIAWRMRTGRTMPPGRGAGQIDDIGRRRPRPPGNGGGPARGPRSGGDRAEGPTGPAGEDARR